MLTVICFGHKLHINILGEHLLAFCILNKPTIFHFEICDYIRFQNTLKTDLHWRDAQMISILAERKPHCLRQESCNFVPIWRFIWANIWFTSYSCHRAWYVMINHPVIRAPLLTCWRLIYSRVQFVKSMNSVKINHAKYILHASPIKSKNRK